MRCLSENHNIAAPASDGGDRFTEDFSSRSRENIEPRQIGGRLVDELNRAVGHDEVHQRRPVDQICGDVQRVIGIGRAANIKENRAVRLRRDALENALCRRSGTVKVPSTKFTK